MDPARSVAAQGVPVVIAFPSGMADEYVLGLLEPEEELRLDQLARTNEGVARALAEARDRFLELDLQTAPHALPDGFSDRVLARLETPRHGLPQQPEADAANADPGASASLPRHSPASGHQQSWWLSAAAAVLALSVGIGIGWQSGSAEPQVIAVLMDEAGSPRAVVEDFGDDTARLRFLSEIEVPRDRIMQVWTLPSADLGPKSMGLLPEVSSRLLDGFELPDPQNDQLYEITFEPEGGSPTGRPTGPILAKGYGALQ